MKRGIKLACLVVVVSALAQGAAVSQTDIQRCLSVWQKRAGLQQWAIRVQFADYRELTGAARSDAEWHGKSALIRFLYPEQWERVFGQTPEVARERALQAVIHQLIHLVISDLYDDGVDGHTAWLEDDPANEWRMECVAENLTVLLLRRRAPAAFSVEEYVRLNIDSGPWKPSADVKQRVMLQLGRAMNAATEDDM
jgi:hypothetical protein